MEPAESLENESRSISASIPVVEPNTQRISRHAEESNHPSRSRGKRSDLRSLAWKGHLHASAVIGTRRHIGGGILDAHSWRCYCLLFGVLQGCRTAPSLLPACRGSAQVHATAWCGRCSGCVGRPGQLAWQIKAWLPSRCSDRATCLGQHSRRADLLGDTGEDSTSIPTVEQPGSSRLTSSRVVVIGPGYVIDLAEMPYGGCVGAPCPLGEWRAHVVIDLRCLSASCSLNSGLCRK